MSIRNYLLGGFALLTLMACGTSRRVHEPSLHVPDTVVPVVVVDKSRTDDSVNLPIRYNTNKVEAFGGTTWQGRIQRELDSLCNLPLFETTQIGVCVYDLTDRQLLFAVNADHRMRPASCQKIVTAVATLHHLGANHSFTPVVLQPGWGWCWDDKETGMNDFGYKGDRSSKDTLFVQEKTMTIAEVLMPMMKQSDNMLAESMFHQLATAEQAAGNASAINPKSIRKEATKKINATISQTGLKADNYTIADGSGLSLYDYASPRLLTHLLIFAYDEKSIFDTLYPTLPIAGVDGTLSKRMTGTPAQNNVHAKTGTVTGVSSLTGYCTAQNGHLLAFSIINQGLKKSADGRSFQDCVCAALCK